MHERQMNGPNAYTLTEPWSLLYAFRKNRPIVLKGAVMNSTCANDGRDLSVLFFHAGQRSLSKAFCNGSNSHPMQKKSYLY
jgi:hypothetical protein